MKKDKRIDASRAGLVLAISGAVLLAVLTACGAASFDGTSGARLTVTRACGSVSFIGIIMYFGYCPRARKVSAWGAASAAAALAVAVNNMPILPLLSGEARVTAGAAEIAGYAVESFFVGLFEETAFRGVLLLAVAERFGRTKKGLFLSAVVTSAAFGASHLFNLLGGAGVGATLLQVSYSFLIGGMCSLVLLLSGSLAACVVIHAVYDFGGYLVPRLGEGTVWTVPEVALTAAVGTAALVFFLAAARKLSPGDVGHMLKREENAEQGPGGCGDERDGGKGGENR